MAYYANAPDSRKIKAALRDALEKTIIADTKRRASGELTQYPEAKCLINVQKFFHSLGLSSLPFSRFHAELSHTVREPEFVEGYGHWVYAHVDECSGILIRLTQPGVDIPVQTCEIV